MGQSLGWNVDRGWFMGGLSSPSAVGHTGFTGTTFVVDPITDSFVIFLSNRVHPTRDEGSINTVRHDVAQQAARAIPVSAPSGEPAWYSGYTRNASHTLSFSIDATDHDAITFDTWFHIANDIERDYGIVEVSDDDGETWQPLSGSVNRDDTQNTIHREWVGSNKWEWVSANFPIADYSGTIDVRFRYETSESNGRGWYIDQISADENVITDFDANGWVLTDH
ncbi:serine hydrolase [Geomicrobium sp. JCM 19037]|uniref:serine hydrolase n=1 Tax=Geomicrobium sp. JCM 19037 TaxID=1460634 RepID=UPI0021009868|nr:serine hydrolase [Geomicrobium sp. JCM 19037]